MRHLAILITSAKRDVSKWHLYGEVTLYRGSLEQGYLKYLKYTKNLVQYEYQEQRAEVEVVGADGSIFVS